MKTAYKWFLIILVVFLVLNLPKVGPLINVDLQGSVVKQSQHTIMGGYQQSQFNCDGKPFVGFGFMSNGYECNTDQDCKDFWPWGPSYQIRDSKGACCIDNGECGYFE